MTDSDTWDARMGGAMDYLSVKTPDGASIRYDIEAPIVQIGRSSENDLVLPDDAVSRHQHARIEKQPGGIYIVHGEGRNGTVVNGELIRRPVRLRVGDEIRLGNSRLVYNGPSTTSVEFNDARLPPEVDRVVLPAEDLETYDRLTPAPRLAEEDSETLSLVLEADKELVIQRPQNEMFLRILDLAHRVVPFERGLLMTLEGTHLVEQVVRAPAEDADISISATVKEHVLQQRKSILVVNAPEDPRFCDTASLREAGVRCFICVPLLTGQRVVGLLYVDHREESFSFSTKGLRVLTHLANVAAMKLETKRLFDQAVEADNFRMEIERAAEIQRHLLPSEPPSVPGYRLSGDSEPCQMVGGDYYDFLKLPGGRQGICLGDVAGHGLSAAILMSSFQSIVRTLAAMDLPPHEMVVKLNRLVFAPLPRHIFITFFYGVLDPTAHTLGYVNAAQNLPVLVRRDGRAERLPGGGLPLGILDETEYDSGKVSLEPGDLLFFYSDGITESRSPGGEEFGEKRLLRFLTGARIGSPAEIGASIRREIDAFRVNHPPDDDVTLVVLKRDS